MMVIQRLGCGGEGRIELQKNKVEKWLLGAGGGGNRERWVKGYRLSALR